MRRGRGRRSLRFRHVRTFARPAAGGDHQRVDLDVEVAQPAPRSPRPLLARGMLQQLSRHPLTAWPTESSRFSPGFESRPRYKRKVLETACSAGVISVIVLMRLLSLAGCRSLTSLL
jgi:hypothetical protein